MFCINCGKEMQDGAKFCANCGHKIGDNSGSKNHAVAEAAVHVRGRDSMATRPSSKTDTQNSIVNSTVHVRGQSPVQTDVQKHITKSQVSTEPDIVERFFIWLKEDWLMKLGALLVLVAIGWFAQYAFSNKWISELGQILIGLTVGVGVMLGGYFWSSKHKAQGGVLLALGSAMFLTVMFIAREVFALFNPTVALFGMFISVTFVKNGTIN